MINREGGKTVITLPKPAQAHASDASDAAALAYADDGPVTSPMPSAALDDPTSASAPSRAAVAPRGPFLPLLLASLALLGWMGFQSWQLTSDRQTLRTAHTSQQQTVDNAAKLRASLDALAADTQRMAEAGNGNAKLLVDELRKRGVTINPAATQSGK